MKKNALATLLLGSLMLSACSEQAPAPQTTETPKAAAPAPSAEKAPAATAGTKQERYIVGTDVGYPPFGSRDESGKVVGFDIDILKAIAKDQGFEVDFLYTTDRSTLFPSLDRGSYQILASCLGITPKRLEISEMSVPYAQAPNIIMSRTDKKANTLDDLKGGIVITQKDSHSHHVVEGVAVKELKTTDSLYNALRLFIRGEADYVVGDAGALSFYLKSQPEEAKKVHTAIYDPNEDVRIGFAVKKGNTELINKINAGLKNIRASGEYDKIYQQWFGGDDSLKVAQQ